MSAQAPQVTRTPEEVRGTPRSAARSLWRTHQRDATNFLTGRLWPWLTNYLKLIFTAREHFRTYAAAPSSRPGVFSLSDRCVIGLAGDWGTGTESAYRVADQIAAAAPDITIHLGDVYYSGTREEFQDYFLPAWPRGRAGTYALNANHEMYSGGEGYFGLALPALKQETSYFCLESTYWRILGLDTGYYARTFPLLELFLKGWIRLHHDNLSWLKEVVFADPTDQRPVVVLTHHQWFSAFDTEYGKVGGNLAAYLDRVVLWLWAHEHRFSGYAPFGLDGHPKVRARCIGHGGMPIELGATPKRKRNLVFTDQRRAGVIEGDPIGYCGFAVLTLDGQRLGITYTDENGTRLFEESWVRTLEGARGSVVFVAPDLTVLPGAVVQSLVS